MAYAQVPESLVRQVKPSVIFVDEANKIISAGDHAGSVPEDSKRRPRAGAEELRHLIDTPTGASTHSSGRLLVCLVSCTFARLTACDVHNCPYLVFARR